jgi:hypothetical protein
MISLQQRVQRGTLIGFLCSLALIVFPTISLKAHAQQWDACAPSPEVKEALDAIPKQTPNQTDWEFRQKMNGRCADAFYSLPRRVERIVNLERSWPISETAQNSFTAFS